MRRRRLSALGGSQASARSQRPLLDRQALASAPTSRKAPRSTATNSVALAQARWPMSPTRRLGRRGHGATRKIVNVSAGTISATSTDAVNGAELYAAEHQMSLSASRAAVAIQPLNTSAKRRKATAQSMATTALTQANAAQTNGGDGPQHRQSSGPASASTALTTSKSAQTTADQRRRPSPRHPVPVRHRQQDQRDPEPRRRGGHGAQCRRRRAGHRRSRRRPGHRPPSRPPRATPTSPAAHRPSRPPTTTPTQWRRG